ncbi:MAG: hypothetical protein HOP04_00060 [Methylophilaceae bacterium]|nr:hypothetical protein [Methylophilaceae bacterium]
MLGIWGNHAGQFLSVVGWLIIVAFAIPITFWPFQWAKLVGWEIPQQTHLALYFGRCLGCVGGAVALFSILAANNPMVQPFYFKLLLTIWASMVILHIYGAIKKIQPILETLEIGFWLGLALLTLAFWPT